MADKKIAKPLKIGVFGAGMMGRNHIAACQNIKNIELVGIFDVSKETALKTAKDFNCKAFDKSEELAAHIDGAIVATTSSFHTASALPLLEKGVSCLIEKPLATTQKDCNLLLEAAAKTNATLMVGHIEHFNPAVTKLFEIVDNGLNVLAIEARRMSAASGRITDVDVAMDLMIHDIEIILALAKSKVVEVQATAVNNGKDYITANINFENGITASAVASRITTNRIRTLALTAKEAYFDLDFISQKLSASYQGRHPYLKAEVPDWAKLNVGVTKEQIFVPFAQAVPIEINHFVDCVVNQKRPLVNGEDALNALKVIWEVQKKLKF